MTKLGKELRILILDLFITLSVTFKKLQSTTKNISTSPLTLETKLEREKRMVTLALLTILSVISKKLKKTTCYILALQKT